jgi:hypothetical protein
MTARAQIDRGPLAGPLALSWRPLNPPTGGGFGGVSPMTVSAFLFSSFPSRPRPSISSFPLFRSVIPSASSCGCGRGHGGVS